MPKQKLTNCITDNYEMLNIIFVLKNVNIILIKGDFTYFLILNPSFQTRNLGAKCNLGSTISYKIYKN
ncbi:hypothetical protein ASU31_03035 [Pedobacter ginsenosidimutans]|uniref:Uncharacterized protein n=1 Tax=Pedobacter ginsenosidimutans TaxID=687842 RepID=A0A0T5VUI2_9SPHI|nr:hypothetical protein ASU31_03035 [Pedobacter ginsenosidimutans]